MRVDSSCEGCYYCSYDIYGPYGTYDPGYYCELDHCIDDIPDEVLDALIAEDQKNEMEKNYRGPEE